MNPPDVYDADGHLYDRRQRQRGEDDPGPDVTRGYAMWAKFLLVHRGKVVAAAVAVSGCIGAAATAVGLRLSGPTQEIARVERKVDTLATELLRVKASVAEGRADREQIKSRLDVVLYMQCVSMRRTDPASVHAMCNESRRP